MNGIAILGALPGSPAEECGLKYGDILLSVNGEAMSTVEDFLRVRATTKETMDLLVRRGGHVMQLTIQIDKSRGTRVNAAEAIEKVQHLRLVPSLPEQGPLN